MKLQQLVYFIVLILVLSGGNLGAETVVRDETSAHEEVHSNEGAHHNEDHHEDAHHEDAHHDEGHLGCGEHHGEYDAGATAMHHIADANVYSIGPFSIPLPCIVYVKGEGLKIFSSGKFDPGHHGNGHYAIDGFVLNGGALNRVSDSSFPKEKVEVCDFSYRKGILSKGEHDSKVVEEEIEIPVVVLKDGRQFDLEAKSTLDGGLFGGGITSWYDFSLTKNVVSMIIVFIFLTWMFFAIRKLYQKNEGNAPSGIQSFVEPVFAFIQDEVSKPILGNKWEKYQPFLMSVFFFILGLNLFGQIPFFGNSNVTGHISVTIALALFTALVVNLSGNKHYWEHILWMPGVPAFVKVILTPVELLGVILKPMTLFIRLFGNLSAGHMVIVIFVSLIFIFGQAGESLTGSISGIALSVPLTMFMLALELLVAFLQAFVFTILSAVYIGAAVEEHH
ncbi:MAG: F0F1 ATP synthase subunit A [Chitinophagales bacterium]